MSSNFGANSRDELKKREYVKKNEKGRHSSIRGRGGLLGCICRVVFMTWLRLLSLHVVCAKVGTTYSITLAKTPKASVADSVIFSNH